MKSEFYRRWWAGQKVVQVSHHIKVLHHPVVGLLTLQTEALAFPGDPDQTLFTFLADPGSPSGEALKLLAGWVADHGHQPRRQPRPVSG
ncbi:MAG TPA: hypothetical protein VGX23_10935 [Actinocrinis sp.]|nr:hypothetical protein [Actinocrinis sp.]